MTPERKEKLLSVLSKRQNDITVVLENVFDPHNISAVMRTCDAVGVQDIYILNTKIPGIKNGEPVVLPVLPNGSPFINLNRQKNASNRSGSAIPPF